MLGEGHPFFKKFFINFLKKIYTFICYPTLHTLAYYSFAISDVLCRKELEPSVQIISVSNEGE
jgi:hypothetical protein